MFYWAVLKYSASTKFDLKGIKTIRPDFTSNNCRIRFCDQTKNQPEQCIQCIICSEWKINEYETHSQKFYDG